MKMPSHITTTVIGFTDRMPDLMAAADLFITKSGTVSVSEGIYAKVPMFLDATTGVLAWERFNHSFITNNGLGRSITSQHELPRIVEEVLADKSKRKQFKKNFALLEIRDPRQEIKALVEQLLNEQQVAEQEKGHERNSPVPVIVS